MSETWEQCGEYAAPFIARWGTYLACVLEKGHEGPHMAGGTCVRHGFHTGSQCPHWPTCIKSAVLRSEPAGKETK